MSNPVTTSNDAIWSSLAQVFHNIFDDPSIQIGPSTTAADVDQWDSLTHVQLIVAVEAKFAIRFKHSEVAKFERLQDMVDAIKQHLDSKGV